MQSRIAKTSSIAAAAALTLLLAACDKPNETIGQKVDSATASVERKAEDVKSSAAEAATSARDKTEQMADSAGNAVKDAAITTAVNAKLAGDPSLSALRINVDTSKGHVLLKGEAPSLAARERATTLAASVDGVISVDNRLNVHSKS